jgi:hypothetical protein
MPHKNTLFSQFLLNFLSKGCFLIGMGSSLALWAQNATFDPNTGILHIPTVEVPQVFGTGLDYYQVELGLVPGTTTMTFTLLNAVPIVSPILPSNPGGISNNEQQIRRLLGTWTFSYKILNDYTSDYTLTTVEESTTEPGNYSILGTDEYGDSVIAEYDPKYDDFSLLDKSISINNFFIFKFTSEDTVSGCYYLIPAETSELSDCFNMTGTRIAKSNYRMNSLKESLAEKEQRIISEHRALQAAKRSVPWVQVKDMDEETYERYKLLQEAISSQLRSEAQ